MALQVAESESALRHRLEEARALAVRLEDSHRAEAEARREAQAANKAKADVLASISHEIRTPVSAVLAYSELLRSGVPDAPTEKQKEFLRRIDECAHMLGSLVDDVLDFSVIESGELRVDIGVGCVEDAIRIATASIEPKAERKGVSLTSRSTDGLAFLADPQRVRQIVMNLLSNAVKFTPEGGHIVVSCAERDGAPTQPGMDPGRWIGIEVRDTGIGIAPDELDRVFEPFRQAERGSGSTDERGPRSGVGLGLAISRHLAHAMSGTITVESELGHGSKFTVWLPSGSRQHVTEPAPRPQPASGRTRDRTPRPA
jgi:signal transduction histidine kinase